VPEEPTVWEIRLGIYTTRQQADEITERVGLLLCPDPNHTTTCPIPWSITQIHGSNDYPELDQQHRPDGDSPHQARH
jgi:hypothetical protein